MAQNLPGPYQVDFEFLTGGRSHHTRLNCLAIGNPTPGTPATSVLLQTKGLTSVDLETAATQFWSYIRPDISANTTVTSVTFWRFVPNTKIRTFITALSTSLPAGSNPGAYVPAHQRILTFYTGAGKGMRISFSEDANNSNQVLNLVSNPSGFAGQQLAYYALSAGGWMIGADDSYPTAARHDCYTFNNAIERERYR